MIYQGAILDLTVDSVALPKNLGEAKREVVRKAKVVAIVAVNDGKILLVNQFRYPVKQELWEIPAGKVDEGESSEVAAARELEEETGLRANDLQVLSTFYTSPGFTDEEVTLFVAKALVAVENPKAADWDEDLEVEWFTRESIRSELEKGTFRDAKTLIGLLWYLRDSTEIF